jgi:hypothetical protein
MHGGGLCGIPANRLQCPENLRTFNNMMKFSATIGFRHLRRPWIENPGWVAV